MRQEIKQRAEMIRRGEVPEGYKRTKVGIIPKGWEVKKLKEIADVKGGKRLPKGYFLEDKNTGYPYITVSDMCFGGVNEENIKYVPKRIVQKITAYRIYTGDLFISVAGTLGIVGSIPDSLDGANLTENADRITNIKIPVNYLKFILFSPLIQNEVKKERTTNAQPKLALTRIRNFHIPVSEPEEMTAISQILTTADKAIETTETLITLKQQKKKWLMQNLLTGNVRLPEYDNCSVPVQERIRMINDGMVPEGYKETKVGIIPRELDVRQIKDFGKVITGSTPPTKDNSYYNGEFPWVTPTDINGEKYIDSTLKQLTKKGLEKSRILPKDSVLVTCIASIGKNCILKSKGSCNQQINAIVVNSKNNFEFLYYVISHNTDRMKVFAGQTATQIINKTTFEKFSIASPQLNEQTAIANVLSTADKEIDLLNQKLDTLKQQKKALMQLLLTGIVRTTGLKSN